jgi:NAD(P)-dependent dehydrogenase (short-subunit alcohol dehydrogenase family)
MKWTLVTGGAQRLGENICKKLAQNGHNVIIHYNTSFENAIKIAMECRNFGVESECIQGDFSTAFTTQDFIRNLLLKFPSIHHLINNVGNYLNIPLLNTSTEQWNALFQTNLNASFAITQALLPSIIKSKGRIINIGMAGISNFRTAKSCPAYSMTKIGLLALTRALAQELAPHNVCVNMVSPGQLENSVDLDLTKLPMKRAETLEEIIRVIIFLLDKESEHITGQNIEISGGYAL